MADGDAWEMAVMSTIIISNDMNQPYGEMVTEALHEFGKRGINKIAMIGLSDDASDAVIGYYNMQAFDKSAAAAHIQSDVVMKIVLSNIDAIKEAMRNE